MALYMIRNPEEIFCTDFGRRQDRLDATLIIGRKR